MAAEVGINRATLCYYVGTKEELLVALLPEAVSAVCGGRRLLDGLRRTAVTAGATWLPGTVSDPVREEGVWHASIGGTTVSARHLELATGAPPPARRTPQVCCARARTAEWT